MSDTWDVYRRSSIESLTPPDRSVRRALRGDLRIAKRARKELKNDRLEQIVLDPGPDFAKTPAQTVAVLRRLDAVLALGRPVLLAVSRKDFVGALTGREPRE